MLGSDLGAPYSVLLLPNVALACTELELPSSSSGKRKRLEGHREAKAGGTESWPSSAITSSVTTNSVSSSVKWNC